MDMDKGKKKLPSGILEEVDTLHDEKSLLETKTSAQNFDDETTAVKRPKDIVIPHALSGERYRFGEVLGRGGMATVYEAFDHILGRSVAIKVLHPERALQLDLKERFFYEARILAQMDHPGILAVYDSGTLPDKRLYYAMKKIQGRTLEAVLDELGRSALRTPERRKRMTGIFQQVCDAVAHAHARGTIHRDLKPENVMIEKGDHVVVVDWGVGKNISASESAQGIVATQTGVVKGTPAYMSPEQVVGRTREIDSRSDVFSLGVMLYVMLTARLPFAGNSDVEVMDEVMHRRPPPPRSVNPDAPRGLDAICRKAMRKQPERRYPDAGALGEDVRLWRRHKPNSVYRPGLYERLSGVFGK